VRRVQPNAETVNYVGYLAASGEVFIDSLADSDAREPVVLIAGRGGRATAPPSRALACMPFAGASLSPGLTRPRAAAAAAAAAAFAASSMREVGLQLALSSMRRGERAAVYVTDPAYGYGKQGSFSFPSVPPSAALVYVVSLVAWEPPEEVRTAGVGRRGLGRWLGAGKAEDRLVRRFTVPARRWHGFPLPRWLRFSSGRGCPPVLAAPPPAVRIAARRSRTAGPCCLRSALRRLSGGGWRATSCLPRGSWWRP
jgi:hypothetical protein